MKVVIVTGMSGAGRSSVLKMLEDSGFFCVDNIPVALVLKFLQLSGDKNSDFSRIALGIDIRSGIALNDLDDVLDGIKLQGYEVQIIYLDASTPVLVKRYKETRRNHPLAKEGRVDEVIETERKRLEFLKDRADYIIDTSTLLVRELKEEIDKIFVSNKEFNNLFVTIVSFGFKYGIPADADLVFDVRFLPNPYYIPELKPKSGNDKEVFDYVMNNDMAKEFMVKLEDMCKFLIPKYVKEGKYQLVIGIGCTGGKHRSVSIANSLYEKLQQTDYGVKVDHRDVSKG
ncbi:MAG: RNase adapter RapZ [Lachnospiraceae bacterium]|nr:RNase adapter RapZ [Lachnospiraceae bacterium]